MTQLIILVMILSALHFVGDFIFQSDDMSKSKATDIKQLLLHCMCYILPFVILLNPTVLIILFVSHFCIDFVTSKIIKKIWVKDIHGAFVTIGFDQFLHQIIILICAYILIQK